MEDSQPPSVESFSYTWLANRNSSLVSPNTSFRLSFDATDRASFIEMNPNLTPSKRFLVHQDYDFNVPKPEPTMAHVHTDKLVSSSILVLSKSYSGSDIRVSPLGSTAREEGHLSKIRSMSLRNDYRKRSFKSIYMDLVRPIWRRIRRGGSDSSQVQGVENYEPVSKMSGVCLAGRCDTESSIHEAVVHCKKTFGMDY